MFVSVRAEQKFTIVSAILGHFWKIRFQVFNNWTFSGTVTLKQNRVTLLLINISLLLGKQFQQIYLYF